MGSSLSFLSKLPPLRKHKSPVIACLVGFLFGGVGLGIYFRSLLDFVAPIVTVVLVVVVTGAAGGALIGGALAAAYGFCRAIDSNYRLEQTGSGVQIARTA